MYWILRIKKQDVIEISSSIIECAEKCACRDWSKRVHYISIKHAPYVALVHKTYIYICIRITNCKKYC